MMNSRQASLLLVCFLLLLPCSLLHLCHGQKNHTKTALEEEKTMIKPLIPKPHFVLVHGFGLGAWSWYKMRALLTGSGYEVTTLDLKGAGADRSDSSKVTTFKSYNQPLINFMSSLEDNKKVILVGYSAGGLSVTDASHRFSWKIQVAVYLSATMLKHGFMTQQDLEDGAPAFIRGGVIKPTNASKSEVLQQKESQQRNIRCFCSQEDDSLAAILFRTMDRNAFLSARFRGNEADKVKRVYIKTIYDSVLLPEQQEAMIRRWQPAEVYPVESDHNLNSCDPFLLFGLLVKIAATYGHH